VEDACGRPREGAGLGLAVVERLVEAHGARPRTESRRGEGPRATVAVPPRRVAG